jgi:hypothetical protein
MNVHGGSVAIGHPFAATGARILATLAHAGRGRFRPRPDIGLYRRRHGCFRNCRAWWIDWRIEESCTRESGAEESRQEINKKENVEKEEVHRQESRYGN